jgi:hypothetical protein
MITTGQGARRKNCRVEPVLTTIENGLVIEKLGRQATADREKLQEVLDTILGT